MKNFIMPFAVILSVFVFGSFSMAQNTAKPVPVKPAPAQAAPAPAAPATPTSLLMAEKEELKSMMNRASGKVCLEKIKTKKFQKRLPFQFYKFKQKLTDPQKEAIFKIQAEYNEVVASLRARLANLDRECKDKIIATLTPEQKKEYDDNLSMLKAEQKKKADQRQVKVKADRAAKAKAKADQKAAAKNSEKK